MEKRTFAANVIVVLLLSIQLVSMQNPGTEERCLTGNHHKRFPSAEPKGFATCFPWQNKSCCSPETTVKLKETGLKLLQHIDWDYCGDLSEQCREQFTKENCFYFCDPNLIKWKTSGEYVSGVPICSRTCDEWFEACKNDSTYSENWLDEYALYHKLKGPVKTSRPCRTFGEIFKNGEGLCNKLWGLSYKYERSSNCMVFDFKDENPNDKVLAVRDF